LLKSLDKVLDEFMRANIERDREELKGTFCRACGYCMPCPAGIPIPTAARMSLLLRRMPYQQFMTNEWKAQMLLIQKCKNCGQCKTHCPYQLDTPKILQEMLNDYQKFCESHPNNQP
jgi:predicted aldo/keto reductase-like oxidoreductase